MIVRSQPLQKTQKKPLEKRIAIFMQMPYNEKSRKENFQSFRKGEVRG